MRLRAFSKNARKRISTLFARTRIPVKMRLGAFQQECAYAQFLLKCAYAHFENARKRILHEMRKRAFHNECAYAHFTKQARIYIPAEMRLSAFLQECTYVCVEHIACLGMHFCVAYKRRRRHFTHIMHPLLNLITIWICFGVSITKL